MNLRFHTIFRDEVQYTILPSWYFYFIKIYVLCILFTVQMQQVGCLLKSILDQRTRETIENIIIDSSKIEVRERLGHGKLLN